MTTLRIIIDPLRDATFNMAADQYLLGRCENETTVFVRFYTWKKPSITLGYAQKAADVLCLEKLKKDDFVWIRRPTGGRAVLHQGDLTYCCIFPNNVPELGSTIKESYSIITRCLINGLSEIGISCSSHDSDQELAAVKRQVKLPCFLAPNRDEVMVKGRKLVGSAQKRTLKGVLQHGSIPINKDFSNLPFYLNIEPEEQLLQKKLLLSKSISLQEIKSDLDRDTIIHSLRNGFAKTLQFDIIDKFWSDEELNAINEKAASEEFIETWTR